jgi:4-alpha-glucanotransferase
MHRTIFEQFLFEEQWSDLKKYANARGVCLFGDLPVYVDMDSVEVWWRRDLFQVDACGRARGVSGVPPDYFSEDGQLWGHPIYDWDRMRASGFRWWVDRIRRQLRRFDLLRVDHFRAFEAYWEVPGDAETARVGEWKPGPGAPLLEALGEASTLGALVAEDLGLITAPVRELRDRFGLPGMLVLQFAFDGSPDNPFLPKNHVAHAVVYTGTHDNDTTLGWYRSLSPDLRRRVDQTLAAETPQMPDALIEAACRSIARMAVVPMQDLLRSDSIHRMNTPGTTRGNWGWRFRWEEMDADLATRCRRLLEQTRRIRIASPETHSGGMPVSSAPLASAEWSPLEK